MLHVFALIQSQRMGLSAVLERALKYRNDLRRWRADQHVERLRARGLTVGRNFLHGRNSIIDWNHCHLITIGDDVVFAPEVYVFGHDASIWRELTYFAIGRVIIEDRVFVGARSIIMPNVTIGHDAIIGAGSVVTKSVDPDTVVAGNPARPIARTSELLERHRKHIANGAPRWGGEWRDQGVLSEELQREQAAALAAGLAAYAR